MNLLVAAPTFDEFHNTVASHDGQLVFHLVRHTGIPTEVRQERAVGASGAMPACDYPYKWDGHGCMNCYHAQRWRSGFVSFALACLNQNSEPNSRGRQRRSRPRRG